MVSVMKDSDHLSEPKTPNGYGIPKALGTSVRTLIVLAVSSIQAFAIELVPDERTAVFPTDKARDFTDVVCLEPPAGITGFWTPSLSDLRGIETSLVSFLRKGRPARATFLLGGATGQARWTWIRRQATGILKEDGKYLLVVYHFEDPAETAQQDKEVRERAEKLGRPYRPDRWKDAPLVFHGRGSAFFRVLFDLTKREFVWYEENPRQQNG